VPSVKSLLVRARMGLAEGAGARVMTCAAVQDALESDDDATRKTARRHARYCADCAPA
jgi:hypothetical protein